MPNLFRIIDTHAQLNALGPPADDHPQYLSLLNSRTVSGLHTFNTAISGLPAFLLGPSNFGVLVSGLNAQYLNGYDFSQISGLIGTGGGGSGISIVQLNNVSGYLDGRDQSISGYLDARLTRVSGLAGGIINVSGYLSSLINTNASDYPSGNIFYTDGVGVRTNNKFKYNQASNGNISLQVGNTGDTISNTLQLGSTTLIDNLDNTPNGLLIKQNNLGVGNLYFFDANHRIANSNGSAMGLTAPNFVLTRNASDANTAGNQIFFALQPTYAQASGTAVNTSLLIKRLGFASGTGTNLFLDCQNASGVSLFNIDAVTGSVSGTYISTTSGTFGGVNIKTLIEPEIALPYSSGIVTNASSGSFFKISASGNFTLYNPINNTDCQILRWKVIQDASGSRLLTLDSNFKKGPFTTITLSTASGAIDYLSAKYDNDSGKFHIVSFLNGY